MDERPEDRGSLHKVEPGRLEPNRINPRSPREMLQPEQAPEPPRRSRHARHPVVVGLNFLLTAALLIAIVAGAGIYWGKSQFEAKGPLAKDTTVTIRKGSSLEAIADQLEREGIVSNATVFSGGVWMLQMGGKIRAGEFRVEAGASMRDVMQTLVSGRTVDHKITIPEGLSTEQIVGLLRAEDKLTGEVSRIPEEGTLLPETYHFTRGTGRMKLIERMRKAHDRALAQVWERRSEGLPISSPRELLILASIVQREAGKSDELSRVAAVFVNRLKKRMRLQSDPTILYGLFGGKAWDKGHVIKQSEKDKPNVYSTYQINGLPPGPIANPGKAALEAVANPSRTDDLYFVADGNGGHIFSSTLKEHNRHAAKWRKLRDEELKEMKDGAKDGDGGDDKSKDP